VSKRGFASEKVMKNYLSALLDDDDEEQKVQPQPVAAKPVVKKPVAARPTMQRAVKPAAQRPLATATVENELRPVAKLLEKVNILEQTPAQPAAPAPKIAPKTVSKPVAKAPAPKPAPVTPAPLPSVETLVKTQARPLVAEPPKAPTVEKEYRKGQFQALFFDVAGLTLAVPLTELGGIHNMGKLNTLVGKPDWFMGVMINRETRLSIVNTAKWVMPEKYDNDLENELEYQYIIMLDNSQWGLACEKLINTVTLEQDDVKWREHKGRRPWLAGLIKERMCALIDVTALIEMFEQGQNSQDSNS
jgi:purine-binding chemotaxis protein CheW